ncbi:MAG: hypothetical protein GF330_10820, partial [Candidatus Eisenbacteria bacterium]|nr:hypothetical protein [Candidatus Eisenbacteria bacterium]
MSRRSTRPPRRLILGILLISLSLLTALSLPGIGLHGAGGPFAHVWVRFWVGFLGLPGAAVVVLAGLLWGAALLLRWPRDFLWRLAIILGPLVVSWDAWMLSLGVPSGGWLLHGRLGIWLYTQIHAFFGMRAAVQVGVALGTLAVTSTILLLRWGLPAPAGERVGLGLRALLRALWRGGVGSARALAALLLWFGRGLLMPLSRIVGRAVWRLCAGLGALAER